MAVIPETMTRTYPVLSCSLAAHYRDEPRVEVVKKPGEFFIMEWGKCSSPRTTATRPRPTGSC